VGGRGRAGAGGIKMLFSEGQVSRLGVEMDADRDGSVHGLSGTLFLTFMEEKWDCWQPLKLS